MGSEPKRRPGGELAYEGGTSGVFSWSRGPALEGH
jgi:hypothetical protein